MRWIVLCDRHRAALVTSLRDHGLGHLLGLDPATDEVSELDPAVGAQVELAGRFMTNFPPDSPGCPLCNAERREEGMDADWIADAAATQYVIARGSGRIPGRVH